MSTTDKGLGDLSAAEESTHAQDGEENEEHQGNVLSFVLWNVRDWGTERHTSSSSNTTRAQFVPSYIFDVLHANAAFIMETGGATGIEKESLYATTSEGEKVLPYKTWTYQAEQEPITILPTAISGTGQSAEGYVSMLAPSLRDALQTSSSPDFLLHAKATVDKRQARKACIFSFNACGWDLFFCVLHAPSPSHALEDRKNVVTAFVDEFKKEYIDKYDSERSLFIFMGDLNFKVTEHHAHLEKILTGKGFRPLGPYETDTNWKDDELQRTTLAQTGNIEDSVFYSEPYDQIWYYLGQNKQFLYRCYRADSVLNMFNVSNYHSLTLQSHYGRSKALEVMEENFIGKGKLQPVDTLLDKVRMGRLLGKEGFPIINKLHITNAELKLEPSKEEEDNFKRVGIGRDARNKIDQILENYELLELKLLGTDHSDTVRKLLEAMKKREFTVFKVNKPHVYGALVDLNYILNCRLKRATQSDTETHDLINKHLQYRLFISDHMPVYLDLLLPNEMQDESQSEHIAKQDMVADATEHAEESEANPLLEQQSEKIQEDREASSTIESETNESRTSITKAELAKEIEQKRKKRLRRKSEFKRKVKQRTEGRADKKL